MDRRRGERRHEPGSADVLHPRADARRDGGDPESPENGMREWTPCGAHACTSQRWSVRVRKGMTTQVRLATQSMDVRAWFTSGDNGQGRVKNHKRAIWG